MAFVNETERDLSGFSKTMNVLGPGQYFKDSDKNPKRDVAPFKSSSLRKTPFHQNDKPKPGPGNYEIAKPFVQPNIKTITNSQSIVVKINSTGTPQFKSAVDRFTVRDHEVPGPGKYSLSRSKVTSPRAHSSSHHSSHESEMIKKLKQMTRKNYPAIPEKVRGLTDNKKEEPKQEVKLGPAFYNPKKKFYLNSTSTVWGKDKSKRFSVDLDSEVGPGKYDSDYNPIKPDDKVKQASSHFKSNLVRTYWDSLMYNTNVDETAKVRENSKFKSKQPAPGQYQINQSSMKIQDKPFSFQFFGSTVQRFSDKQIIERKSKSFYNIKSDIGRNHSFNKSEHAFLSDTKRSPEFLQVTQDKEKAPGPGYYKQNVKVQKKMKGNKLQKFGTNEKRIFQIEEKAEEVGPGKYQKEVLNDQIKNNRFGQVKEVSCNFKSSTNRDCFGTANSDSFPFAQYDVSHYNLSKKIEKQKNFLQNLKKIDVQKAPFESSISRFPHYQTQKSKPKSTAQQSKEQQIRIKNEAEKVRQMILQANKTQVKETRKQYFGGTNRFGDQKKTAPPVGSYSLRSSWDKKSHNIKYQHK